MTLVMWHFRNSNNLLIFCVLLLCTGFMLQFKVLYNNHQKHLRIQEIKDRMSDFASNIHSLEVIANTTNTKINELQRTASSKRKAKEAS